MANQEASRVPEPNLVKLRSLLEGARIAMLTSIGEAGSLVSRPMALQELDASGYLWFFTGLHSNVVAEIRQDSRINVSVMNGSTYVSMSGNAVLVDDVKKASELWNPAYKTWFPKGLEDPDLTLLRFSVERAEFWDTPGGVVTNVIGYVKSLATGETADTGEHGELGISHRTAS